MVVRYIGGGNRRSARRKPPICRESGFELTTLVVIGTDCKGSYKSTYHTITTAMAPNLVKEGNTAILYFYIYF